MKLLVSDYDKTFDVDIKESLKAVASFRKHNLFAIATGRSFSDFLEKEQLYNIKYDYLIINHGATIIKNNTIISNISIEEEVKNKIIELTKNMYDSMFCCTQSSSRAQISDKNITKIHFKFKVKEDIYEIKKQLEKELNGKINCYILSSLNSLEITAKKATKENAIKIIKEQENLKKEDIYTVGDSYTDIGMLNMYQGYAMENSIKALENFKKVKSISELINKYLLKKIVIAIDGKSATGKSTLTKMLAKKINYDYLNTGAIYRIIALEIQNKKIDIKDSKKLQDLLSNINIKIKKDTYYLNDEDVTGKIFTQEIAILSTKYASNKTIKEFIRSYVRTFAKENKVIVEGRDIGTIVFPQANIKFYLYSSLEVRAKRLYEKRKQTENITYKEVLEELKHKDKIDEVEKNFIKPSNAVSIDTSNLTLDEVLNKMINDVNNYLSN